MNKLHVKKLLIIGAALISGIITTIGTVADFEEDDRMKEMEHRISKLENNKGTL